LQKMDVPALHLVIGARMMLVMTAPTWWMQWRCIYQSRQMMTKANDDQGKWWPRQMMTKANDDQGKWWQDVHALPNVTKTTQQVLHWASGWSKP
jgi:hypothetical protein